MKQNTLGRVFQLTVVVVGWLQRCNDIVEFVAASPLGISTKQLSWRSLQSNRWFAMDTEAAIAATTTSTTWCAALSRPSPPKLKKSIMELEEPGA